MKIRPAFRKSRATRLPGCSALSIAAWRRTPSDASSPPRTWPLRWKPCRSRVFRRRLPSKGRNTRRQRKALAWWIGLAAIVAASIATYYFVADRAQAPFAHYSLQRVIDSKHVGSIAISPDGIYLAAVVNDANGAQSLLLHHIPTNSQRTIVQDPAYKYDRVTFSPDGSYIYFRIDALGQPRPDRWDEYRIPVLGGQPTRVIAGVDFPLTFIDGGQQSVFLSPGPHRGLLPIPQRQRGRQRPEGSGEREKTISTACRLFSDGKFAVLEDELGNVESLEFGSGSTRTVASSAALGGYLNDMQWIPNGKGLFITGWEKIDFAPISFLSYPSGKLRQITNDLSVYSGISLTAMPGPSQPRKTT